MATKKRKAKVSRKTTETDITLEFTLDGGGRAEINSGIPFFDHMLELFTRHGLFDLELSAKGDIEVDFHHTVEDVGLSLGGALKKALGDKKGIRRYGRSDVPMMDSLPTVVLDLSGRPFFKLNLPEKMAPISKGKGKGKAEELNSLLSRQISKEFDMGLAREFITAFSNEAGVDIHVTLHYGDNLHHAIEAVFKALGRALREAVEIDPRLKGVMSTKGKL